MQETASSEGGDRKSSEIYWRIVSHSALSMACGRKMTRGWREGRQVKVSIDFEDGYNRPIPRDGSRRRPERARGWSCIWRVGVEGGRSGSTVNFHLGLHRTETVRLGNHGLQEQPPDMVTSSEVGKPRNEP